MRMCLLVVVALAAVSFSSDAAAQQAIRADAVLVHAEGAVHLNDRALEPNSTPAVLPDKAELGTTQGRAAVALKRGGLLFSTPAHLCACSGTGCTTSIGSR